MTGVAIIGALARGSAALTEKVAPANMKAGTLSENAPLPSLLFRTVSVIERIKLKRTGMIRWTERVAVTVRAVSYRDQTAIMRLLPSVCAGKTGTIAGAANVSTTNAGIGPDVGGPGGSFEQTIDFRVSFETPA